jgi:hypothetical protein
MDKFLNAILTISDQQLDEEEMEDTARLLISDLQELPLEKLEFASKDLPQGAKGDPISIGTILLTLAASGGILTSLIAVLQAWVANSKQRSVTMKLGNDELIISGIASNKQEQLIQEFLSRHRTILMPDDKL